MVVDDFGCKFGCLLIIAGHISAIWACYEPEAPMANASPSMHHNLQTIAKVWARVSEETPFGSAACELREPHLPVVEWKLEFL